MCVWLCVCVRMCFMYGMIMCVCAYVFVCVCVCRARERATVHTCMCMAHVHGACAWRMCMCMLMDTAGMCWWSVRGLTASSSRAQGPQPVRQRDQRAAGGHLWPAHVASVSEGARVGGCMGPWEEGRQCVGACVAWCDLAHVYVCGMHACACLYWYIYARTHTLNFEPYTLTIKSYI
jgi:hypothetical protein